MSLGDFFSEATRSRAAQSIARIEAQTSVEVVVTVRRQSDDDFAPDLVVGFAASMLVLIALLFAEQEFSITWFPVDLTLAFVVGALLSSRMPWLRRWLRRPSTTARRVAQAARAAFYELGISKTRGRSGVLVYISLAENAAEIVPDVGVSLEQLGTDWATLLASMRDHVRRRACESFFSDLEKMGPLLAQHWPRGTDDINELPDNMHVEGATA